MVSTLKNMLLPSLVLNIIQKYQNDLYYFQHFIEHICI